MTVSRSRVGRSQVFVNVNDAQEQRVFVRFADEDARERAQKVLDVARAEAPVGKGPTSGALRASLKVTQSRETTGRYATGWDVSANTKYAMFVIKGTRPHVIKGNPFLAFFWPKVNAFVVFRSVNHPGTKPNDFLSRALRAAR